MKIHIYTKTVRTGVHEKVSLTQFFLTENAQGKFKCNLLGFLILYHGKNQNKRLLQTCFLKINQNNHENNGISILWCVFYDNQIFDGKW